MVFDKKWLVLSDRVNFGNVGFSLWAQTWDSYNIELKPCFSGWYLIVDAYFKDGCKP